MLSDFYLSAISTFASLAITLVEENPYIQHK